mmetsp:Transcript_37091/g.67125  ORF Transcript_37091/g.67125 Transcript_37091/m.67125 type:complete len:129 (-) Transcript_37091:462-848(-)
MPARQTNMACYAVLAGGAAFTTTQTFATLGGVASRAPSQARVSSLVQRKSPVISSTASLAVPAIAASSLLAAMVVGRNFNSLRSQKHPRSGLLVPMAAEKNDAEKNLMNQVVAALEAPRKYVIKTGGS